MKGFENMKKDYYELSQAKLTALEKEIAYLFDADEDSFLIMHPRVTYPGRRHIDTITVKKEDEMIHISAGISAKRNKGCPFSEAFIKAKSNTDETKKLCNAAIIMASGNTPDNPVKYECGLYHGYNYEYTFFDEFEAYHEKTGYWGVFIVPKIPTIIGSSEYLFYQLIPAYKEELMFVEENESVFYGGLCEAIVKQIPERQYLDVKHKMLSQEQLEKILRDYRESGNLK